MCWEAAFEAYRLFVRFYVHAFRLDWYQNLGQRIAHNDQPGYLRDGQLFLGSTCFTGQVFHQHLNWCI
jgi:hypothetical protein